MSDAVQEPEGGIDNTLAAAFAHVRARMAESEAPVEAELPVVEAAPVEAPVEAEMPVVEAAPVEAELPVAEAAPVEAELPVAEAAPVEAELPVVEAKAPPKSRAKAVKVVEEVAAEAVAEGETPAAE
jgi:hypothetical protein